MNIFKKLSVILLIISIILITLGMTAFEIKSDKDFFDKAEQIVNKMTLEEKVDIVVGGGMDAKSYDIYVNPINLKKDVDGVAGYINGVKSLGLPAVKLADGPAGLRINPTRDYTDSTYYATGFPIATQIASTWNTNLSTKIGEAIGNEVKEYGVDFWLAPALNIQRNPLCGRNFEYYSEDPLISGKIAASIVNGVQSNNIGATIKHFAANNSETNRETIDTIVTERALREIYLRGFQIAVEDSQPWAVMTSFNKINGTYTSESEELIETVLRNEWDFKGLVMTDWFSGESSVAKMRAGNDLIMPGSDDKKEEILSAVEEGSLEETIITRNATRIIKQTLKTPTYNNYDYSDIPKLEENSKLSRSAATEGMVLLKNDKKTLPIKSSKKVAAFGVGTELTIKGGTGSGDVHSENVVSINEGLNEVYKVDEELQSYYKTYVKENSYEIPIWFSTVTVCEESDFTQKDEEGNIVDTDISSYVENNDAAVIVITRISGEGEDRKNEKGDFQLTNKEQNLIEKVSNEFHKSNKKVTVVLNIGGAIEMASWVEKVDAVLVAWQPGQEAGYAIADVLTGKVNPSGKLTQTFPVNYSDNPSSSTFPGVDTVENPSKIVYDDDIYVGYRYYSTFDVETMYEFGYGLSYTNFKFSKKELRNNLNSKNNSIDISLNVKNNGKISGKEVVQAYVSAPNGKLSKPSIELKAFAKTKELKSKESQKISMSIDQSTLASYNSENSKWVIEKGLYKVYISSSSDVRNVKPMKFYVKKDIIVDDVTNVMSPTEDVLMNRNHK